MAPATLQNAETSTVHSCLPVTFHEAQSKIRI